MDSSKAGRYQIAPLNPEQGRALPNAVQGHRLEGPYRVALPLGLRLGEALGLRWEDVDPDAGTLRVAVALQRRKGSKELVEPKTHQSRRPLPLPSVLLAALKVHRMRQLEERFAAGPAWKDHGLVVPSTVGTAIEPRNLTRHFKSVLQAAGLPDIRFHDLRHTVASLLVAQGVHPRVVMEILGHSQISLTMNIYAHVLPEAQRAAVATMDALFVEAAGAD